MKILIIKSLKNYFAGVLVLTLALFGSCGIGKNNEYKSSERLESTSASHIPDSNDEGESQEWMYLDLTCATSTVGFEDFCWANIISPPAPPLSFTEEEVTAILQGEEWAEMMDISSDYPFHFCAAPKFWDKGGMLIFKIMDMGQIASIAISRKSRLLSRYFIKGRAKLTYGLIGICLLSLSFCLFFLPERVLTLESAQKEMEKTAQKISQLFNCPLQVAYDDRKPPKWMLGGFYAKGYCFSEGGEGVITVNLPLLEENLKRHGDVLDRDSLAFIIAHESSHILLGQGTEKFIKLGWKKQYTEKESPISLTFKREGDADTLAAKIHREFGRPIENVLKWMKLQERHSFLPFLVHDRSTTIKISYEEGWKAWSNWNNMGPICHNLVAEMFKKNGAKEEFVKELLEGFCKP